MNLQERETAISILEDRWRSIARNGGHIAVISGEPGIGKTMLVDAFLKALPPDSRRFRGACEDFSIAEPLGPLREIGLQAGWSPAEDGAGTRVDRAIFAEALEALTSMEAPTVVAIEDLHWADDATLDFLRYLGRRMEDRKLLLIVTSRDGEAEGRPQMRRAFADVPSGRLTRIPLDPLSLEAVGLLAAGSGRDPAALHEMTGGNPFFVAELLSDRTGAVPRSVQDAVLVRAERLDPSARRLLNAVSVFPRRAGRAVISEMFGDRFRSALEDCLTRDILEEDGGFLAFRHELARQAIEHSLSGSDRSDLHGEALRILSRASDTPRSALLHHARQTDDAKDVATLALVAANEAEALGSNREAAEYYKVAIDRSENLPAAKQASLLEKCASCSFLIGRFSLAIEMQERALALLSVSNDPIAEGEACRKLSRYQWIGHATRSDSERSVRRAVEILTDFPGPELAMAHATLSQLMMLCWEIDSAIAYAGKAIDFATSQDRSDILCHAYDTLGTSLIWSDPDRGATLLERSIDMARQIGEWDTLALAYGDFSEFEFKRLRFGRGVELADLALAVCEDHELDGASSYFSGIKAWNLLSLGRWDEARAAADAGLKPTIAAASSQARFPAAIALVQHMTRTGEGAAPRIEEEMSQAQRWTETVMHLWIFATTLAERAWLGFGGEDRAVALLEECVRRVSDVRMVPHVLVWLRRLRPEREFHGIQALPAPFRRQLAGDWRAAARGWAEVHAPYEQALALCEGDEAACNEALALLDRLGAAPVIEMIHDRMRRNGMAVARRGPQASTAENPRGLTRRQMDVLFLLGEGLSNARIADRLFVSPKTVDHHVSAILAKLEASTRGEAAAIARKEGLLDKR